ncbi:MAG: hypothetical protein A2Z40_05740 [Deltaproteobacteria bacterium RBG_19FT_COMBO_60_16]|nr:MAG: hypothetical protein A2Z40_05740 [Deltaproteobacteria bacterium RBG_19FT_COMBO_60_16]
MKRRMKKRAAGPTIENGPVTRRVVGKGISHREWVSVDLQHPNCTAADIKAVLPKGNYTFEGRVAFAEKWAKETIEAAGRPTDRAEERVTDRWYAAEILTELRLVRSLIERGETAHAAHRALDLGMLLRELYDVILHNRKVLKWEGWQGSGSVGGSQEKMIRPLLNWICYIAKRDGDKPSSYFWNSLPNHEEGDSPAIINGVEMIRERENGTLLLKATYRNGRICKLALRSFQRYVTDAKKSLTSKK